MQRTITLLFLLTLFCSSYSQTLQWTHSIGGSGFENGEAVLLDSIGNVYLAGQYNGEVDLDPGPGVLLTDGSDVNDVFLVKLDEFGQYLWSLTFTGSFQDIPQELAFDQNGDILLLGRVQDSITFPDANNTTLVASAVDVFLVRITPLGQILQIAQFEGAGYDVPGDLLVDRAGNIFISGDYEGTMDADPDPNASFNLTSTASDDAFLIKLDHSFQFQWAISIGGLGNDYANDLAIDDSNHVFVAGYFNGSCDFDPSPIGTHVVDANGNLYYDLFIAKFDSLGNFMKVITGGDDQRDAVLDMEVDVNNNIYISGYFMDSLFLDTAGAPVTLVGDQDVASSLVAKYDNDLNLLWAHQFGDVNSTGDDEIASQLEVLPSQDILVAGVYQIDIDLDPGIGISAQMHSGDDDIYLVSLDSSGSFLWGGAIIGPDLENLISMNANSSCIALTGLYRNMIDADPGPGSSQLASNGVTDVFITKLGLLVTAISDTYISHAIEAYYDPANSTVTLSTPKNVIGSRVVLLDATGRVLKTKQGRAGIDQISLAPYPTGLYIIQIDGIGSARILRY